VAAFPESLFMTLCIADDYAISPDGGKAQGARDGP